VLDFTYAALQARVVFAEGALAQVGAEVARLGCSRPFVISGEHQRREAIALVAQLGAPGAFTEAAAHTPVDVTELALAAVQAVHADCLVALGGGTAIGLAKAIALRTDLPQIAIPTTYAGSEATPILGQTEHGMKTTLRDPRVLPEVIVYDVALTLTLPPALTVLSGLNAMAHAVEALYAPDANPITSELAEHALLRFAGALPKLVQHPGDREARGEALLGAWTAGTCLGSVAMGLHHKLCHTLGGSFDLPHAETHAVMLPYTIAYNAAAAPSAMAAIERALGVANAADGMRALALALGAPRSLQELGMSETAVDRAADLAILTPYPNPRPLERTAIRALLAAAWSGTWASIAR
jgi:alcohol dehydrogenase class IV